MEKVNNQGISVKGIWEFCVIVLKLFYNDFQT